MQLVVGTIGRANGLRGEVAIDVRSDSPETRLAIGTVLATDPPGVGPLTIDRARHNAERWVVGFREVTDRTGAEALRGVALVVDSEDSEDEDAWYPHELAGLRVELLDGTVVGEVVGLQPFPAQDALVVRETSGARTLVPFVRAIVPVVDVPGGRIVLDPPAGLLASDEAEEPDEVDPDDDADGIDEE
jgi:16S rRNA processing protein RimM